MAASSAGATAHLNLKLVLVIGGGQAKEEFCASLATKVEGSVLDPVKQEGAASEEPGFEDLRALLQEHKIVPVEMHLRVIKHAMATLPSPHLLVNFPRMKSHLSLLEAMMGRAGVALHLQHIDEVPSKVEEALLKPLHDSGRVVCVRLGELAVAESELALRNAGVIK